MTNEKSDFTDVTLYINMIFTWKTYFRMIVISIVFLMTVSCNSVKAGNKIVSIAEVDITTSAHSTTRQFQRKVLFAHGKWHIFYSNGQDALYRSSADGKSWSSEDSVLEKGSPYSSGTDVIFDNNKFYYFNSLDGDPSPDKWTNMLKVREGWMSGDVLRWGDRYRLFEDGNPDVVYSSVSMDPDGYIWVASRHMAAEHKVIVSRSVRARDIKAWIPRMNGLRSSDAKSMAPQIIGVGNGKAYVVAKATEKGTVFGNFYDGEKWENKDSIIGSSSKVAGDDKRMTMVFEPGKESHGGRIHLVYIDNNDLLRYRVLEAPYRGKDWSPQLDEPGSELKDSKGLPIKAFTCVLSIDNTQQDVHLYLLYGETKFRGRDPRQIAGELRLLRFSKGIWSNRSLLMSAKGTTKNLYPNMIQFADEKIGILYMKGMDYSFDLLNKLLSSRRIMFSSADIKDVDRYFDQARNE